jgi:DNA-binding Lrp family transcriptional regulator
MCIGVRKAWVLVNTILGKEREALKDLRRIPGVKEAHIVTGEYDIMLLIEASSMKQLEDVLTWNIRRQRNICDTVTMIVA